MKEIVTPAGLSSERATDLCDMTRSRGSCHCKPLEINSYTV